MSEATRVVFDCNVLVQALAAPDGPSGQCVSLAMTGQVHLFLSPGLLAEFRDVTSRPKVIAKLRLRAERVEEFFAAVQTAATILDGFPEIFGYKRDPG